MKGVKDMKDSKYGESKKCSIPFRCSEELRKQFKLACIENDTTMQEQLTKMVVQFIKENMK